MDYRDISLPSGEVIYQLSPSEVYKYLDIMECDIVKSQLMKLILIKEYKRHVLEIALYKVNY